MIAALKDHLVLLKRLAGSSHIRSDNKRIGLREAVSTEAQAAIDAINRHQEARDG